jgi:hypothetical protein
MNNNPYEALEGLKLLVMYSDVKLWAWSCAIIAGIALAIFMVSEFKLMLWLGVMAVLVSVYFFMKLGGISDALARHGIFL